MNKISEIYMLTTHVLLYTSYRQPDMHRHFAKHFAFSAGQELTCMISGIDTVTAKGVAINSGVEHTIDGNRDPMLIFLIDETTDFALEIDNVLLPVKKPFCILKPEITDHIIFEWSEIDRSCLNRSGGKQVYDCFC